MSCGSWMPCGVYYNGQVTQFRLKMQRMNVLIDTSEVLEKRVDRKYLLTPNECEKIVLRAKAKGFELVEPLASALFAQMIGCQSDTEFIGSPIPIDIRNSTRYPSLGKGTGMGIGKPGWTFYTLSATYSNGVCCDCEVI